LTDSSESGSKGSKNQQQMKGSQSPGTQPPGAADSNGRANQSGQASRTMNMAATHQMQPTAAHPMMWDDPSQHSLVLLNPRMSAAHSTPLMQHANGASSMARAPSLAHNARMQGQLPSAEHYHPHSANAIQLANQLRHATASKMQPQGHHHAAGDLADYIGGLHPQPAVGYDWSAINAASAAVASTHSSLAALGLHPHRAAMVNFSVQDHARVLMAREQQTAAAHHAAAAHRQQQAVAFLGAAPHAYAPVGAPHFAHMGGPSAATAALLMGHSGMPQAPATTQVQSGSRVQSAKQSTKSEQSSKKAPRENKSDQKQGSSKKDQKKDISKVSSMKEGANDKSGEQTSGNGGVKKEAAANRKRKLSDQDKTDSQQEKKACTTDKVGQSKSANENSTVGNAKAPDVVAYSAAQPRRSESSPAETSKKRDSSKDLSKNRNSGVGAKEKKGTDWNSKETAAKIAGSTSVPTQSQNSIVPKETSKDAKAKRTAQSSPQGTDGMQFFVPPAPPGVSAEIASLVLGARSYQAVELVESGSIADGAAIVDYLIAVGTAVPIHKALVANPFKDRMNAPSLKTGLGSIPPTSREVILASILLWLWRNHEEAFQRAFAKSGRIDVDPECKWLIHAAVDKSVQALCQEIADAAALPGSQLTAALMAYKSRGNSSQKTALGAESDRSQATTKLDLLIASIVSKALMAGLSVDEQMDSLLPNFHDLLNYLDECRKCALHSKSQERALLAALISRKATMSLPFSHAYVSSIVRAGEAIGHGELFEVVQNEEVNVSTMIPYDVFTDESGAWEDPCRPIEGFTSNLTGDDLMRRAHARAMIQKSLKKLQDRHNIKGGAPTPGAYIDPPSSGSGANSDSNKSVSSSTASTTPRGWLKRRSSFSEPPVQAGTGSAAATSWSLYDPRHYSAPLVWKAKDSENSPYGRHNKNTRARSLSMTQFKSGKGGRGKAAERSMSVASYEQATDKVNTGSMLQSTREIAWSDVAGIFQNVTLPGMSLAQKEKEAPETATPRDKTIFAPFVRKIELSDDTSSSESDEEEDLRDDEILLRHQIVLDRMKSHLSEFLEVRKNSQDRRKSRNKT
jgi:hypothetical protein